jgi:hypothetical protein
MNHEEREGHEEKKKIAIPAFVIFALFVVKTL